MRQLKAKDFCSILEASRGLGITRQGVHYLIQEGLLPGYRIGRPWIILKRDVRKLARSQGRVAAAN